MANPREDTPASSQCPIIVNSETSAKTASTSKVKCKLHYNSNWIAQTARKYWLEWVHYPTSCFLSLQYESQLSREQERIPDLEVHNLLNKKAIEKCHNPWSFCTLLFIIPQKGWFNRYPRIQHFKISLLGQEYPPDVYPTVSIYYSLKRGFLRFQ